MVRKIRREKYTEEEDQLIKDFVRRFAKQRGNGSVGGNLLWKQMAQERVTSHSWQSMRDRYLKFLRNSHDLGQARNRYGQLVIAVNPRNGHLNATTAANRNGDEPRQGPSTDNQESEHVTRPGLRHSNTARGDAALQNNEVIHILDSDEGTQDIDQAQASNTTRTGNVEGQDDVETCAPDDTSRRKVTRATNAKTQDQAISVEKEKPEVIRKPRNRKRGVGLGHVKAKWRRNRQTTKNECENESFGMPRRSAVPVVGGSLEEDPGTSHAKEKNGKSTCTITRPQGPNPLATGITAPASNERTSPSQCSCFLCRVDGLGFSPPMTKDITDTMPCRGIDALQTVQTSTTVTASDALTTSSISRNINPAFRPGSRGIDIDVDANPNLTFAHVIEGVAEKENQACAFKANKNASKEGSGHTSSEEYFSAESDLEEAFNACTRPRNRALPHGTQRRTPARKDNIAIHSGVQEKSTSDEVRSHNQNRPQAAITGEARLSRDGQGPKRSKRARMSVQKRKSRDSDRSLYTGITVTDSRENMHPRKCSCFICKLYDDNITAGTTNPVGDLPLYPSDSNQPLRRGISSRPSTGQGSSSRDTNAGNNISAVGATLRSGKKSRQTRQLARESKKARLPTTEDETAIDVRGNRASNPQFSDVHTPLMSPLDERQKSTTFHDSANETSVKYSPLSYWNKETSSLEKRIAEWICQSSASVEESMEVTRTAHANVVYDTRHVLIQNSSNTKTLATGIAVSLSGGVPYKGTCSCLLCVVFELKPFGEDVPVKQGNGRKVSNIEVLSSPDMNRRASKQHTHVNMELDDESDFSLSLTLSKAKKRKIRRIESSPEHEKEEYAECELSFEKRQPSQNEIQEISKEQENLLESLPGASTMLTKELLRDADVTNMSTMEGNPRSPSVASTSFGETEEGSLPFHDAVQRVRLFAEAQEMVLALKASAKEVLCALHFSNGRFDLVPEAVRTGNALWSLEEDMILSSTDQKAIQSLINRKGPSKVLDRIEFLESL